MTNATDKLTCLPLMREGVPANLTTTAVLVLIVSHPNYFTFEAPNGDGRRVRVPRDGSNSFTLPSFAGRSVTLYGRDAKRINFEVVKVGMSVGDYRRLCTKI